MADWLEKLKPGDEVALPGSIYGTGKIVKVAKVTKLHVITESGAKYRIRNGYRVGDSGWDRDFIVEATPAERDKIKLAQAVEVINRVKWKEQPAEVVYLVVELLNTAKQAAKSQ